MRTLYLTNYHNPYRDEFFEQLGERCDLTVLFEQRNDMARDASWFDGEAARSYTEVYLPEGERGPLSRTMLDMVGGGWSLVVVGCYNSVRQMAAIARMRRKRTLYVVNSDGPLFVSHEPKGLVRRHVLRGASAYLVAGDTSVSSIRREVGRQALIAPYPFTSLTERKIGELAAIEMAREEDYILLVGQFLPYKGIDVALDALADMPKSLRVRIIGVGKRASECEAMVREKGLTNVEVTPFMRPDELYGEYAKAAALVLPSRQECWGLVVNEAAACGCPIISTWGSGAAVEFLSHAYPQFLAEPANPESMVLALDAFFAMTDDEKREYSAFLRNKAAGYTIEKTVDAHISLFSLISEKDLVGVVDD